MMIITSPVFKLRLHRRQYEMEGEGARDPTMWYLRENTSWLKYMKWILKVVKRVDTGPDKAEREIQYT